MAKHISVAEQGWDEMQRQTPGSPKYRAAETAYETAISALLKEWSQRRLPKDWKTGTVFQTKERSFILDLLPLPGDVHEVSPHSLDRLVLASDVKVGRRSALASDEGLGVPVVGQVLYRQGEKVKGGFMPLNGSQLTLTAVAEFEPKPADGTPRRCRLHLYNPLRVSKPVIQGKAVALAANYTAPKELALNDGFLRRFSLLGLLLPEKTLDDSRLFTLEMYDPKRIPVIFVHGLMSDPHIWYDQINAIYADPELRANYQPWYFLYPSGMAVPATSVQLRDAMDEARAILDPENDDPGMNQMVLVGHSMGGLVSRMQVIDSGNDMWNAYFTEPPEKLDVSSSTRKRLEKSLFFQRRDYVKRLIFIAVPHRGSDIASRNFVKRLSSLIRLPVDSLLLATEVMRGNTDALSPQVRDWGMFAFLSIGTLSPKHPYLKALNSKPIPVPHHSIIGRSGRAPTLELSSDRVVPYWSSHLPTGTEVIVPWWHGCVEQKIVVDEVVKRLKQHLRENGRK